MFISEKKFNQFKKETAKEIQDLHIEIWKLKNPAEYSKGDHVKRVCRGRYIVSKVHLFIDISGPEWRYDCTDVKYGTTATLRKYEIYKIEKPKCL